MNAKPDRQEQIARIIDPEAYWSLPEAYEACSNIQYASTRFGTSESLYAAHEPRRTAALGKASEIMALPGEPT